VQYTHWRRNGPAFSPRLAGAYRACTPHARHPLNEDTQGPSTASMASRESRGRAKKKRKEKKGDSYLVPALQIVLGSPEGVARWWRDKVISSYQALFTIDGPRRVSLCSLSALTSALSPTAVQCHTRLLPPGRSDLLRVSLPLKPFLVPTQQRAMARSAALAAALLSFLLPFATSPLQPLAGLLTSGEWATGGGVPNDEKDFVLGELQEVVKGSGGSFSIWNKDHQIFQVSWSSFSTSVGQVLPGQSRHVFPGQLVKFCPGQLVKVFLCQLIELCQ